MKKCSQIAEEGRVSVRNARRDGNNAVSQIVKEENLSEDEERRGQDQIQKLTDKYISQVDEIFSAKESEVLTI